jgi:hypothetical protein
MVDAVGRAKEVSTKVTGSNPVLATEKRRSRRTNEWEGINVRVHT